MDFDLLHVSLRCSRIPGAGVWGRNAMMIMHLLHESSTKMWSSRHTGLKITTPAMAAKRTKYQNHKNHYYSMHLRALVRCMHNTTRNLIIIIIISVILSSLTLWLRRRFRLRSRLSRYTTRFDFTAFFLHVNTIIIFPRYKSSYPEVNKVFSFHFIFFSFFFVFLHSLNVLIARWTIIP